MLPTTLRTLRRIAPRDGNMTRQAIIPLLVAAAIAGSAHEVHAQTQGCDGDCPVPMPRLGPASGEPAPGEHPGSANGPVYGIGGAIGAIGVVGALSVDAHSAEFGYWLAKSYRRRGLMPRVIRTFSDYAFQQLRIHRLFATPFSSNLASHRALEKAGFQREGLRRHHHLKQGIYLDAIIYGRICDSNRSA